METVTEAPEEQTAPQEQQTANKPNVFPYQLLALVLVLALYAGPVGAQNTLEIDTEGITSGIFTGANMIFGAGLLSILVIPAGLKFGLNLLTDIVGSFANIRVGR